MILLYSRTNHYAVIDIMPEVSDTSVVGYMGKPTHTHHTEKSLILVTPNYSI